VLSHVNYVRDALRRRTCVSEEIQNPFRTGAINLSEALGSWRLSTGSEWIDIRPPSDTLSGTTRAGSELEIQVSGASFTPAVLLEPMSPNDKGIGRSRNLFSTKMRTNTRVNSTTRINLVFTKEIRHRYLTPYSPKKQGVLD